MYMRLGTWTVRSLCSAGSLTAIARETAKYESDIVGVQELRWDSGDTEPARDYASSYGSGGIKPLAETFIQKRISSAVKM
jgi:hypothetical protein